MTDTAVPDDLTANLFRVMEELYDAKQDVALLERLSSAQERVARLTIEQAALVAAQDAALADEAHAVADARFAQFTGPITVAESGIDEGVLRAAFTITFKRLAYDMYANASLPRQNVVNGFLALDGLVFDFLVERYPHNIPASIMALAPGNPRAAFERYFQGIRRGHLTGSLA